MVYNNSDQKHFQTSDDLHNDFDKMSISARTVYSSVPSKMKNPTLVKRLPAPSSELQQPSTPNRNTGRKPRTQPIVEDMQIQGKSVTAGQKRPVGKVIPTAPAPTHPVPVSSQAPFSGFVSISSHHDSSYDEFSFYNSNHLMANNQLPPFQDLLTTDMSTFGNEMQSNNGYNMNDQHFYSLPSHHPMPMPVNNMNVWTNTPYQPISPVMEEVIDGDIPRLLDANDVQIQLQNLHQ